MEECGLRTIGENIQKRRDTIAAYVVERSIFRDCMDSERKRGSVPRKWWWEQEMDLASSLPPSAHETDGPDSSGDP